MAEIAAKIASVLSDQLVAINAGSSSGVSPGDRVCLWNFVDVVDPDTQEPLGRVRLMKLELRVSEVQEKFATAGIASTINLGSVNFLGTNKRIVTSSQTTSGGDFVRVIVGEPVSIFTNVEK